MNTPKIMAFVLVPVFALTLTSCSAIGDAIGEQVSEQVGEGVIEQLGGEGVDVNLEDGEINIETEDGSLSFGGGEIPDGFPLDQVPLVDGEVISVITSGDAESGDYYLVSLSVKGDLESVRDDALSKLEGAGLTQVYSTVAEDFASYGFEDTGNVTAVSLQVVASGDGTVSVSYSAQTAP